MLFILAHHNKDFEKHSPISLQQRVRDLSETKSFLAVH